MESRNSGNNNKNNNNKATIVSYILTMVILAVCMVSMMKISDEAYPNIDDIEEMTYTAFEEALSSGEVYKVQYSNNCEWMKVIFYTDETRVKQAEAPEELEEYRFPIEDYRKVAYPGYETFRLDVLRQDVKLEVKNTEGASLQIAAFFVNVGSVAFSVFMVVLLLKMIKMVPRPFDNQLPLKQETDKKLTDVIGHEEIMDDLKFIINMLKKPDIGKKIGARIPKGILFVGEPGTGKTLIAKALAGEAGVPFLYMNASNFVELYVGMGAKRVRELFKEAKACAPCIVFIDEIDAVGESRFGEVGGNSERQQTINALLQEMDGFKENKGVLVIAATNNADVLDKALTRSGRFDRTVVIPVPKDWRVRKQLFEHFAENMQIDEDVDFDKLSKQIAGFTGADIQMICNEAAMIAISREQETVLMDNFEEAIDKKILKGNRSTKEQVEAEKQLIMYHEAGHAVVSYVLGKPISRVTVVGTTSGVGGFVLHEDKENPFTTKTDFEHDIMVCYAGRASEDIKFGADNISTGASSDITQATRLIKMYITRYGFDKAMGLLDLNEIAYDEEKVYDSMRDMSNELYKQTHKLLTENYVLVEKLVKALEDNDTLSGETVTELFKS